MDAHPDFAEGYKDGRDPNCPEPSANRSERYKHSFRVGRNELNGTVKCAEIYRLQASKAGHADDEAHSPLSGNIGD